MPPLPVDRILDEEQLRNAQRAAGLERIAFLAGPFIKTNKAPRKNSKNTAAVLRYFLFKNLTNAGWYVTLGEYEKLISATAPLLGDQNNAALAEFDHAKSKRTDAVVLLPSSPGSFLELGSFCHDEEICRKMLVIVDAQYETHQNYMNTGPVLEAKANGAKVEFIDYANKSLCWTSVEPFVTGRARRRAARGIVGR
jgi:hypothetical protein